MALKSYWSGTLNRESSAGAGGGADASGGVLAVDGISRVHAVASSRPAAAHARARRGAVE
jgi:hypothetical protein